MPVRSHVTPLCNAKFQSDARITLCVAFAGMTTSCSTALCCTFARSKVSGYLGGRTHRSKTPAISHTNINPSALSGWRGLHTVAFFQ